MSLPGRPKGRPALRVTSCMCLLVLAWPGTPISTLKLNAHVSGKEIDTQSVLNLGTQTERHTLSQKCCPTLNRKLSQRKECEKHLVIV